MQAGVRPKQSCWSCHPSPQHQLHRVWLQALLHQLTHQLGLLSTCEGKAAGESLQRLPNPWGCAWPCLAPLHRSMSQSGQAETTQCLLLLRTILLPLPSCSKGLNSTSLWEKGMLLWQGFTLPSCQHSYPEAALA